MSNATSLISILSTEHGKLRREQRDIDKRDLQKALKHGTPVLGYKGRWRVEYDGIVFIVDPTMKREITAFPSPLSKAPVDAQALEDHEKAKQILQHKPELCKSHTVLVVDNSGSMQDHDIPLHRDRQVAAYSTLALEYVAEQLFKGTANNSDVVSLVEFNVKGKIVFTREPCSWVLYNKLLSRRASNNFEWRQSLKGREELRADSNYIPALKEAKKLLDVDRHDECALALFFLSDGEPSDARQKGWTPLHARNQICALAATIAELYGECLSISFVGFGNASGDFSTLEAMADACNARTKSSRTTFFYCDKMASTVGTALSSMTTSLTQTRTSLMGRGTKWSGKKRLVASENDGGARNSWQFHEILGHWVYSPMSGRLVYLEMIPPGAQTDKSSAMHQFPAYLAMNTIKCGEGAERLAFRCSLANRESERAFTLGPMVAKETSLVSRLDENMEFHEIFCETQSLASFLADEFNKRVRALPTFSPSRTPILSFLPCSVLELEDNSVSNGIRDVLVEKMLDTSRYQWCKWNDNGGGLAEGQLFRPYHAPLDIAYELKELALETGAIIEENSEEESDDDDDRYCEATDKESLQDIHPSAYLQAFSHFTYLYTEKKVLVCDLQGVYNTDTVPPTFEMTDPAIHYDSKRNRRMVYGRTDKGRKGMQLFLTTHKCSDICQLVNLGKPKKKWKKEWHDHHNTKFSKFENPVNKRETY